MASSTVSPGSFKLLIACPSALSRSQVSVDFNSSYDRTSHPNDVLEDSIHEIWNRRIQENPSLYNGIKFRYGGCISHFGKVLGRDSTVCLHLGLTDYRTFVGTNLNPLWEKFLLNSEDDAICCRHTSSPLGNGAIVESANEKVIALKRSYNVGEFPGYFVFPGGHPEPHEISIEAHPSERSEELNTKISQELFDGIIREVVEEIGVPADYLTDPLFIGISRRNLNVRPTAFFYMKCNLSSKEIIELYSNAQDRFESTQIYAVSRAELESLTTKMPGCHCGGFALYQLMLKAHGV